jgi:hypothetical protein
MPPRLWPGEREERIEEPFAFSRGMDAEATFAMEFSHFEKKADKDF